MAAVNAMPGQSNTVIPQSHVGFDSITRQIERKLLKRGFQFNVICVGSLPRFLNTKQHPDKSRPNRSRQIDVDQYHLRLAPHRLERTP